MAVEKDFELLDDYLANRMSVEERAAFEQKIATEPTLVKELKLQQGVVESLRNARVAELKNILNNVPVPPVGTSLVTKVTIGIAVSALVATTLYFTLSKESVTLEAEAPTPAIETPVTPPSEKPEQEEQPIATEEEKKESVKTEKKTTKKSRKKTQNPVVVEPKIDVFDPTTELEENNNTEGDLLSEADEIATGKSTILVDIDSTSRRHTFHYKMVQDQLTLYGPFEHNLFEILEFFSAEKRTAFLYYKKSYYYIKEADKVTALVPVQDPALLNKLRKQRTGN